MAKLQLNLVNDAGTIRVYAKYDQSTPVFIERITVTELDIAGNTIGAYATPLRAYFGPGQGSALALSHTPSGTNVKQVRATAAYINIDQVTTPVTVAL